MLNKCLFAFAPGTLKIWRKVLENSDFAIAGAGLAGCECALVLASFGFGVTLYEQKPHVWSEAHSSENLAELVCSNSLRSNEESTGVGLLKAELRSLKSPFMAVADACAVPAGKALAVDREAFSSAITAMIMRNPAIRLVRRPVEDLEDPEFVANSAKGRIVAAGPLMSASLHKSVARITGEEYCYFYDAIAPIVWTDTLNRDIVFRASRYAEKAEEGDYLNCPMNREEYQRFFQALLTGKTWQPHEFEREKHFEGCMPIEALAARGERTLTFGPFKPVGLTDPRTGARPWAVMQLRPEKRNMETCNLVGCQTKLVQSEQARIFRLVPGLESAEFARFGSMHRNTYVNAPKVLADDLSLKACPQVYLAGQITGVEGYVESAACGHWLGLSLARRHMGMAISRPPETCALGALLGHLRSDARHFQPSNVHFGLMPEFAGKIKKKERKAMYAARAKQSFADWLGACK